MSEEQLKPLNWTPDPSVGYQVQRRPDGGMNVVFHNVDLNTLQHWRGFALEHLLDSDRLTRNLYDLRQVKEISNEAVDYALEVISDPAVRHIRMAVVVSSEEVRQAVKKIALLSAPAGLEMEIFTDPAEAEAWLDRPLTLLT
jgi:hypothetical protein